MKQSGNAYRVKVNTANGYQWVTEPIGLVQESCRARNFRTKKEAKEVLALFDAGGKIEEVWIPTHAGRMLRK